MVSDKVIYLDADGCIVDFVEGFINIHQRDDLVEAFRNGEFPTTWNFNDQFGPINTWWDKIDEVGEVFWQYLNAYSWTGRLIMELNMSGIPWYVCTTPRMTKTCLSGKLEWLEHHLGKDNFELIMIKDKYRLAHIDALLIDDNDLNCQKFHEAGGRTHLFAQSWNEGRERISTRIEDCISAINVFKEELTYAEL